MKTIELVVYDFSELTPEAKQKAINKWYENEEYPYLESDIFYFLAENDTYFADKEVQYSLSYRQGDGLSFSGKLDLKKWLDEKTDLKTSVKNVLCDYCTIESKGNTGRYAYCCPDQVVFDFDGNHKNIAKLAEKIRDEVAAYYVDVCRKAEKYGYEILEYRMNESEFNELCQENEYTFLPDGTMKNY